MRDEEDRARFETLALPHLDAAYNLARWLTRNDHDAEDVLHEALLRAMRYVGSLRGDNARPWLLQIVRHACYSWLKENRPAENLSLDEPRADGSAPREETLAPAGDEPPALAMRKADRRRIDSAIAALPIPIREVLVLREFEELAYNDIARIAGIPVGTVMSRLSRGRALLRTALSTGTGPTLHAVPRSPRAEGIP